MTVIDLTHTITETISLYPGAAAPKLNKIATCAKNGYNETLLTLASHTATHIDAPYHVYDDSVTLDNMSIHQFIGKAALIDCRGCAPGGSIGMHYIRQRKNIADEAEFIVFYTGWSDRWNSDAYSAAYPHITEDVAEYLGNSGKKGMGLDTISTDPVNAYGLPLHKKILRSGSFIIIENMTNIDMLPEQFTLVALPIKYLHSDGAPARVIALF
ncbi:MAG: cyclase family protein [Clostridiales bacterium]|jgi:kynurenine formamidase|nr:cyclase family protein [Clostridiales bacterium]